MEFGLDKCAKASFKRGKKVAAGEMPLNNNQVIQDLDQAETYKYLGMEEGKGVQASAQVRTECKEQDSSHQYPSSPSNPLHLWSHWLEAGWDTGSWQNGQEAIVYEPDASQ